MDSDQNIDNLVDEITRRVNARLTSEAPSAESSKPASRTRREQEPRKRAPRGRNYQSGSRKEEQQPAAELAGLIDHTLLKPDASREELEKLCTEARKYGFATVCVNATNVRFAAAMLEGCSTMAIAVVGFPLGAMTPGAKAFETREAVRNGAGEIDMVINIGAMKSKDYALVLEDIAAVVSAAEPKPVKVILETASLSHDEKVIACALSKIAGAAFVKTSTGFGSGGATAEDIELMRNVVGPEMGVKASGGVRTREDVESMVQAGATRVGASASVAIVTGEKTKKTYARKYSKGGY
ncbi:MAG: deoxyribose-phosphate aldolase [Deltaproteobacteria bacterium]|jgi:deoxyribose-phosphate aldolase|nr:deoxyribose-phosphate aldolase [Deltaproteobacteria bacterium]MBT6435139.1 deoxyribose-phosphate aldolase [Deltaproteobacteria bacterium]MBT6488605.1 deoxyribose-phosphate aldolase [Deltaproteobacteria bacterium]